MTWPDPHQSLVSRKLIKLILYPRLHLPRSHENPQDIIYQSRLQKFRGTLFSPCSLPSGSHSGHPRSVRAPSSPVLGACTTPPGLGCGWWQARNPAPPIETRQLTQITGAKSCTSHRNTPISGNHKLKILFCFYKHSQVTQSIDTIIDSRKWHIVLDSKLRWVMNCYSFKCVAVIPDQVVSAMMRNSLTLSIAWLK